MAWWAWLLVLLIFCFLLAALILLLPLCIFVHYLRENKKDHISLRVKLGSFPLSMELWQGEAGEGDWTSHLAVGRFRIPAVLLQKVAGLAGFRGKKSGSSLMDLFRAADSLTITRQLRALLKKITLSRLELELTWGWDDPALTGLAAGGLWALLGAIAGLLQEYFSLAAKPRLQVVPLFRSAELRLRCEGEIRLSLYCLLKLRQTVKKIGGVPGGTSSH